MVMEAQRGPPGRGVWLWGWASGHWVEAFAPEAGGCQCVGLRAEARRLQWRRSSSPQRWDSGCRDLSLTAEA